MSVYYILYDCFVYFSWFKYCQRVFLFCCEWDADENSIGVIGSVCVGMSIHTFMSGTQCPISSVSHRLGGLLQCWQQKTQSIHQLLGSYCRSATLWLAHCKASISYWQQLDFFLPSAAMTFLPLSSTQYCKYTPELPQPRVSQHASISVTPNPSQELWQHLRSCEKVLTVGWQHHEALLRPFLILYDC